MTTTFAELLRHHRIAAGLTQEALAEAARCSVAGIAALERGRRRRARLTTARLLADALGLQGAERDAFLALRESGDEESQVDRPSAAPTPTTASGAVTASLPTALDVLGRTPLVGRHRDLDALSAWLLPAARLRALVGEPGVGKTRLAAALASTAIAQGTTVVVGRGVADLAVPYRPYAEIVRALVATLDPDTLRTALHGRGDLARLVPELTDIVADLDPPAVADASTERRLLFEAVATVLGAAGPVLVVMDDIQWIDASSAGLTSYLVTHPDLRDVRFLATSRPADVATPWTALATELGRLDALDRYDVGPLDRAGIAALVREGLDGRTAADALIDAVDRATSGNPFLAEELVTHLLDSGQLVVLDGVARLPPGIGLDLAGIGVPDRVRETLDRRLAVLSPPAAALLGAAAVLGRDADPLLAGQITGLGHEAALDAVDEILATGLVAEAPGGRIAFGHALVQAAVADRLSALRRAAFHRRAAEVRELTPGTPAAVIARHWHEAHAADPALAATAAGWHGRAGVEALRSAAFVEAVDAFTRAADAWETAADRDDDLVAALVQLGDALRFVGRTDEADAAYRRALAHARRSDDPVREARAAMGIGRLYAYGVVDAPRVATIADVLDRQDPADSTYRPALASMLNSLIEFDDRPPVAGWRDRWRTILLDAVGHGPPSPELAEQLAFARPYLAIEDPAVLARTADAVIARGVALADPLTEANATFARAWAAFAAADREGLDRILTRYRTLADRLAMAEERGFVHVIDGAVAQIEGRYDDVLEHATAASALFDAVGNRNGFLMFAGQYALRAIDLGESAAILPTMRDLAASAGLINAYRASIAVCAALGGLPDEARDVIDRFAHAGFASIPRDANWHSALAALAHATAMLGATEHAEGIASVLATSKAPVARIGPMVGWWGPIDHHLGAMARLTGRYDVARSRLSAAERVNTAVRSRPFTARTLLEQAWVDIGLGDVPSARRRLARALTIARSIGATAIEREAGPLQERLA